EGHKRRAGRLPWIAGLSGTEPQLLASVHLESHHRVLHDRLGNPPGVGLLNPTEAIDSGKLARLGFGMAFELPALDLELALEQLGLRRHRNELPRSHRERSRYEACEPREQHDRRRRACAGDTEDQR